MKITDVTVTLFAWDGIPATQYGRHSGRFSGSSDLGLVTITTDQGVEGHAFLGSASRPASGDANLIVKIAKPMLVGEDPLFVERLWDKMFRADRGIKRQGVAAYALSALDIGLWDLVGQAAGRGERPLRPRRRARAPPRHDRH